MQMAGARKHREMQSQAAIRSKKTTPNSSRSSSPQSKRQVSDKPTAKQVTAEPTRETSPSRIPVPTRRCSPTEPSTRQEPAKQLAVVEPKTVDATPTRIPSPVGETPAINSATPRQHTGRSFPLCQPKGAPKSISRQDAQAQAAALAKVQLALFRAKGLRAKAEMEEVRRRYDQRSKTVRTFPAHLSARGKGHVPLHDILEEEVLEVPAVPWWEQSFGIPLPESEDKFSILFGQIDNSDSDSTSKTSTSSSEDNELSCIDEASEDAELEDKESEDDDDFDFDRDTF